MAGPEFVVATTELTIILTVELAVNGPPVPVLP